MFTKTLHAAVSRVARLSAGAALGLGLVLNVAPSPALALTQAQPAATAEAAASVAAPALWVVRDEDSTLYLFGTVHMMRPDADWMTPQVRAAFDSADTLWLELENPGDQAAAIPLIQELGLSPQRPLSSLLTPEEFAAMDAMAQTVGMSGAALDPMRPWLAGLTLSMAPILRAGFDPNAGVDMVLRAQALEAGKPIRGLETMEQQLRIFGEMPEEEQLEFLRSGLEGFDGSVEMMNRMADAWLSGDVEALFAVGGTDMREQYRGFYDVLLTHRNADWVRQIQGMLEGSGVAFIAVGALHLAGPESVQALLEAEGITVERQ